jgi:hypothetical protein
MMTSGIGLAGEEIYSTEAVMKFGNLSKINLLALAVSL